MKQPTRDTVVLIHGLWMKGGAMSLLHWRLARCGYTVVNFSYPTVHRSLAQHAQCLQQFVAQLPADTVHFVAHSLGGLLVRQLLHDFPEQRPGRVVTLGTPHQGSAVARHLAHFKLGRSLLGRSFADGLEGGVPPWTGTRALGVIAGTHAVGLGRLFMRLPRPNDGTVSVAETRLVGMTDHKVMPVSHMGLLVSGVVAQAVCRFLRYGRFDVAAAC